MKIVKTILGAIVIGAASTLGSIAAIVILDKVNDPVNRAKWKRNIKGKFRKKNKIIKGGLK